MAENIPQRVFEIQMSNYIRPEIKEVQGKKWVLNGNNNEFYKTIIDAYNGSTTNSAIIDSYSQFIYGKGLTSIDKVAKAEQWASLVSIFSKKDFLTKLKLDHFIEGCVKTIYIYHHMFGSPFCPSQIPNHFCAIVPIDDKAIDYTIEWFERNNSSLALNKDIHGSPICKKANTN